MAYIMQQSMLPNGHGLTPQRALSSSLSNTQLSAIHKSGATHSSLGSGVIVNRPSVVEHKNYRFLIMDAPTDSTLPAYTEILKKKNVVAVVRACEPSYNTDVLVRNGISVLEAVFPDGDPPSDAIIQSWLNLVNKVFNHDAAGNSGSKKETKKIKKSDSTPHLMNILNDEATDERGDDKKAIAVHCVAGLGRAPVLVAIALIEAGMSPLDAIDFIRRRRRGAFNSKQLKYLQNYKPHFQDKKGDCVIF